MYREGAVLLEKVEKYNHLDRVQNYALNTLYIYSIYNVFMHSNHSAFSHVGSNQRTKCHHKTQQSAYKNSLDNFLPYEEFIQNFLGSMILNLLMSIKKYK